MLRSDLCDYSDACIVVKERISVTDTNIAKKRNKKLTFRNNATFRSHITKTNNTFIDNAEDFDIVITMYNLLEHNNNYSMISESLGNFYRDEANDDANESNCVVNYSINNTKTTTNKSFEYKPKIKGSTADNNRRRSCCSIKMLE